MNFKAFFKMRRLLLLMLFLTSFSAVYAQRVSVKTNGIYWAMLSPNIGTEFRLSRCVTLNIDMMGTPVKFGDTKILTANIAPEVRYWFSGRPQTRWYVGGMVLGSIYEMSLGSKNHSGDAIGLGATFGYSFPLSKRWTLETAFGAGMLRCRDFKWNSGTEKPKTPNNSKFLPAPLKAGVTIVYTFK